MKHKLTAVVLLAVSAAFAASCFSAPKPATPEPPLTGSQVFRMIEHVDPNPVFAGNINFKTTDRLYFGLHEGQLLYYWPEEPCQPRIAKWNPISSAEVRRPFEPI